MNNNYLYLLFIILIILILKKKETFNSISIKNNYLKNIYFITLLKDKKRVKHVKNIINRYNLNARIVKAIDGSKLKINSKLLNNYYEKNTQKKLRSGALGAGLSHVILWKYFLSTSLSYIIVFEDDVEFDNNTKFKLNNFIANLKKFYKDYDICQILHHYIQKKERMKNEYVLKNKYVMKGYPQYGMVGYILSRKGAKKLLDNILPMKNTIDDLLLLEVKNKKVISYCPKEDIIYMPYKFESNIWDTKKL